MWLKKVSFFFLSLGFVFLAWSNAQAASGVGAGELPFSQLGLTAKYHWTQGPVISQESKLEVQIVRQSDGLPLELDWSPELLLWMPDMDHGSSPAAVQRVLNEQGDVIEGLYEFSSLYFLMEGRWEVQITLQHGDRTETRLLQIDL